MFGEDGNYENALRNAVANSLRERRENACDT